MGLASIAAKAAATAFKIAGDVKKPVTIYANPTLAYDTETNASTPTWGTIKQVQGVIYDAKEEKPEAKPETVQKTLIVQGADFIGVELTAETEVDAESARWHVWRVKSDPARAVIILDLFR